MHRSLCLVILAAVTAAGCAADGPQTAESVGSVSTAVDGAPVELVVDVLADGLVGPTQIARDGRGGYVVAELNGGERAATGRVLRFASFVDEPEILVDGLLTPTGVAVDGDRLWIMEQRRLTVGPLDDPADRTIVLDGLPFNGRSEGTISPLPGGGILYNTSGSNRGAKLVDGSGTLWSLAGPDAPPEPVATGLKHAYAHTPLDDGRWFVTEISDGTYDGVAPPDELVIATPGDDFAFPRCVGDNQPIAELGATATDCVGAPASHAVLPPRSTPTGVAIAPWNPDLVLVALWNENRVVSMPVLPGAQPHALAELDLEVGNAQHLLADADRLLVTDHAGGRILSIRPNG